MTAPILFADPGDEQPAAAPSMCDTVEALVDCAEVVSELADVTKDLSACLSEAIALCSAFDYTGGWKGQLERWQAAVTKAKEALA